jgi:hypothetical protein
MGLASSKAYLPNDHDNNPDINQKVDTNVICIGFSVLKNDHEKLLSSGDPIFCKQCRAAFSFLSKITNEEKDKVWKCDFCNFKNFVMIEDEEIPKTSDVIYMVESANMKEKGFYLI